MAKPFPSLSAIHQSRSSGSNQDGESVRRDCGDRLAFDMYRDQAGAVALEDRQNIVVQRFADLNADVTRAGTERIAREGGLSETAKSRTTARRSRIIDAFLKGPTVTSVRNSRLVDVSFQSSDPALSSRVANALARQYIEQNLEFKFLATKEATHF